MIHKRASETREQESSSDRPLVSVVIPTYNRVQQPITAIESVLAQTYSNVEIIVVNDGSTDGSDEAIQRFINQKMNRCHEIIYVDQPNQGASAARNTGIAKARGEYIAFLDSDDVWLPQKLEWQMRAFKELKDECGACFTDSCLVNNSGMDISSFRAHGRKYDQTIGVERDATIALAGSFSGFWVSTLVARADKIRQIVGFNPDISFCEDRDFHFRLSLVTSFAIVNKQLIRTDRNPSPAGSTCRPWDKVECQFRQNQNMLEKWLRTEPALPPDVRRIVVRGLRCQHSQWANWYLENARYDEALQAVSKAMRYGLTPALTVKWALAWFAPTLARRITPKVRPIGTGGHAS
jgi:hypothetical protein